MRNRQWCRRIRRPEAAGDGDEAEAVWGDGETWNVPALTCGALSAKASHAKKAQPTLWSSPHLDGGLVSVKPCISKESQWYIIWRSQGSKLLHKMQLRVNGLSEEQCQPALSCMKEIADMYVKGHDMAELKRKQKHFFAGLAIASDAGAHAPPTQMRKTGAPRAKPSARVIDVQDDKEENEIEKHEEQQHDDACHTHEGCDDDADIEYADDNDDAGSSSGDDSKYVVEEGLYEKAMKTLRS